MTQQITDTLTAVSEAVAVPAPDQVRFQAEVRRVRTRRRTGTGLLGAAAVAAVATAGLLVTDPAPTTATGPSGEASGRDVVWEPLTVTIPMARRGELHELLPGRGWSMTNIAAEEVLSHTDRGLVLVGPASRVSLVGFQSDGETSTLGPTRGLLDGQVVQRAVVAKDGGVIAYVDLRDRLRVRELDAVDDLWVSSGPVDGRLLAASPSAWVASRGGTVWLFRADDPANPVALAPQGAPRSVEIAGERIAVESVEGVQFFDAGTGEAVTEGGVGGQPGALAPDGSAYVSGVPEADVDAGATPSLFLVDPDTAAMRSFAGYEADFVVEVTWTGERPLVVASTTAGNLIYECDPATLTCLELDYDPTRTVDLPGE